MASEVILYSIYAKVISASFLPTICYFTGLKHLPGFNSTILVLQLFEHKICYLSELSMLIIDLANKWSVHRDIGLHLTHTVNAQKWTTIEP